MSNCRIVRVWMLRSSRRAVLSPQLEPDLQGLRPRPQEEKRSIVPRPIAVGKILLANVRDGSDSDVAAFLIDIRSTPTNGHRAARTPRPKSATKRHAAVVAESAKWRDHLSGGLSEIPQALIRPRSMQALTCGVKTQKPRPANPRSIIAQLVGLGTDGATLPSR